MTRHATNKPPIRAATLAKSVPTTSGSAKSDAAKRGPADRGPTKSGVAKPVVAKPVVAKSVVAKPGPAKSGAARPALRAPAAEPIPFWKRKSLEQMTAREWESLCDGCGRCCLNKLEEEGTQKIHFTDVACKLLDHDTCRCKDYRNRLKKVPDCVGLTPAEVRELDWLPPTCAYDLLAKGKDLYWWHPLVSGDPETVHAAGVSVRGRVGACESQVPDDQLENWIVRWPGRLPKGAGRAVAAASKRKAAKT